MELNTKLWRVAIMASFLLFSVSCIKLDMDTLTPVETQCEVVDVELEVLCNKGIYPVPIETRAVPKESVMLYLHFDVDSVPGHAMTKLKDRVEAIRIISKSALNADITPGEDITSYFRIKNKGMDELSSFHLDHYFVSHLELVMLLEPEEGAHELEVRILFESGKEIVKSTGSIYLI